MKPDEVSTAYAGVMKLAGGRKPKTQTNSSKETNEQKASPVLASEEKSTQEVPKMEVSRDVSEISKGIPPQNVGESKTVTIQIEPKKQVIPQPEIVDPKEISIDVNFKRYKPDLNNVERRTKRVYISMQPSIMSALKKVAEAKDISVSEMVYIWILEKLQNL